jgi:hypothetical protein
LTTNTDDEVYKPPTDTEHQNAPNTTTTSNQVIDINNHNTIKTNDTQTITKVTNNKIRLLHPPKFPSFITPNICTTPLFTINPYAKPKQEPPNIPTKIKPVPDDPQQTIIITITQSVENTRNHTNSKTKHTNTMTSNSTQDEWETKCYDSFDKKMSPYSSPLPVQTQNDDSWISVLCNKSSTTAKVYSPQKTSHVTQVTTSRYLALTDSSNADLMCGSPDVVANISNSSNVHQKNVSFDNKYHFSTDNNKRNTNKIKRNKGILKKWT